MLDAPNTKSRVDDAHLGQRRRDLKPIFAAPISEQNAAGRYGVTNNFFKSPA